MSLRPVVLSLVVSLYLLTEQALPGEPPAPSGANAPKANQPVLTDHYGDPLPKGARFRLGTLRLWHGGVSALAWRPDGRTLASAGQDNTVRLWQIPGGKQLAKWDNMEAVVFSADGRTLTCRDAGGTTRLIDPTNGKELRRTKTDDLPGLLSPDRKIRVEVEEKGIHLYAVSSGKKLRFLEGRLRPSGTALVFAPDGRALIGTTEDGTCCWDIGTGAKSYPLRQEWTYSLAFSPDGKTLAAAVNDEEGEFSDNTLVTLRSWPAGKESRRLRAKGHDPKVLAFSADGKLLATGGWGNILLWDLATGEQPRRFEGLRDEVRNLAFSPDGSLLAAAGGDNTVSVWEVRAGKSPRPLTGVHHRLNLVGLAADGLTLLTRSAAGTLTLWDSREGRHLRTLANGEGSAEKILFGPDASRIRALLWQDVKRGWHRPASPEVRIACSAFSPDNAWLAVGGDSDGSILLLRKTDKGIEHRRLDDNAPVLEARKRGYSVSVSRLTFSPDGRTLAATYSDDRLILWDPRTGRLHHRLSLSRFGVSYRCLEFSPDSRVLALSDGHGFHLVETASGQQFRQLCLDRVSIDSLAFAPDNRTLAIGGADLPIREGVYEANIRLWDLPTQKQIHVLRGHRDDVRTLVFSPNGTFLLSGSNDNTVLSWDVATLTHRRPNGKKLAAAKLADLWIDLASKDAARAQRAVAELIQAPDAALPFLAQSLPPVPPARMARIAMLIADLDSEEYARREKATRELEKFGESAALALRKVLKEKPTLEMRLRITTLLEGIDKRPPSLQWLRTLRALQVLESLGTLEAKQILEGLARGASAARLTEEAKASLRRLNHR